MRLERISSIRNTWALVEKVHVVKFRLATPDICGTWCKGTNWGPQPCFPPCLLSPGFAVHQVVSWGIPSPHIWALSTKSWQLLLPAILAQWRGHYWPSSCLGDMSWDKVQAGPGNELRAISRGGMQGFWVPRLLSRLGGMGTRLACPHELLAL